MYNICNIRPERKVQCGPPIAHAALNVLIISAIEAGTRRVLIAIVKKVNSRCITDTRGICGGKKLVFFFFFFF